jgi:hypothetical protein
MAAKGRDKKIAAYVRKRTEPVERDWENSLHARRPQQECSNRQPRNGNGSIWALFIPPVLDFEHERIVNMLYTIAVVLIILWLLGLVTAVTMGGLIHVLLVIAIVVVLLRVISGRRPL